jgi:hypothetical protein
MAEEYRKLTRDELEELAGEELPERAAMSLVNADLAIPIRSAGSGDRPGDGEEEQQCLPPTRS